MPDTTPLRWPPDKAPSHVSEMTNPPMRIAMLRGASGVCPCCGASPLFDGYLRVVAICRRCEAPLGGVRADDAPPYFTILIVGHVVVGLMVLAQTQWAWGVWTQAALFLPLTLVLTLALLRPVKGATVGLMLHLGLARQADGN